MSGPSCQFIKSIIWPKNDRYKWHCIRRKFFSTFSHCTSVIFLTHLRVYLVLQNIPTFFWIDPIRKIGLEETRVSKWVGSIELSVHKSGLFGDHDSLLFCSRAQLSCCCCCFSRNFRAKSFFSAQQRNHQPWWLWNVELQLPFGRHLLLEEQ